MDRQAVLAALRARISRLERPAIPDVRQGAIAIAEAVDRHVTGGGLELGAVHEVLAADIGAGTGFAALLAARASAASPDDVGTVLWISEEPDLFPAGLVRFGLRPGSLVVARGTERDVLWAAEEALRSPAVAAVVLEAKRMDLTVSRRLQLAAEANAVLGLVLRRDETDTEPSSLRTRWRVWARPGNGYSAHDLGLPVWRLELLKARGTAPRSWELMWDEQAGALLEVSEELVLARAQR